MVFWVSGWYSVRPSWLPLWLQLHYIPSCSQSFRSVFFNGWRTRSWWVEYILFRNKSERRKRSWWSCGQQRSFSHTWGLRQLPLKFLWWLSLDWWAKIGVRVNYNRRRILLFLWSGFRVFESGGVGFALHLFSLFFLFRQKVEPFLRLISLFFFFCLFYSPYEDALCISILRLSTWSENRSSCSSHCTRSSEEYFLERRAQTISLDLICIDWISWRDTPSVLYEGE